MTYTAENPHADGNAASGARPRYRPPRHIDLPATSSTHYNWMAARQTSCRQQTAPPQHRCSKDVTAHPHLPGACPDHPCPVPVCSGQPLSGLSGFSHAFRTEFFSLVMQNWSGEARRRGGRRRGRPPIAGCHQQRDMCCERERAGEVRLYYSLGY